MGVADDFATRMVNFGNIGVLTPVPTIFIGTMPAMPDQCTGIRVTGGMEGVYAMGRTLGALVTQHAVQVLARALTFSAAETLAWRVYAALDNWEGTLNGNVYLRIVARHPPYSVGQDEQQRTVFTCNYVAQRRDR